MRLFPIFWWNKEVHNFRVSQHKFSKQPWANGVILPPEELRILGQRWELEHSGRNGRTAQQFVTHYLGQMKDDKQKQL